MPRVKFFYGILSGSSEETAYTATNTHTHTSTSSMCLHLDHIPIQQLPKICCCTFVCPSDLADRGHRFGNCCCCISLSSEYFIVQSAESANGMLMWCVVLDDCVNMIRTHTMRMEFQTVEFFFLLGNKEAANRQTAKALRACDG